MQWQPILSAILNGTSAIFLVLGYINIRQGKKNIHQKCMLTAVVISSLFLINYLIYHALHGSTRYQGTGVIRWIYFVILITHIILAALMVPFVLRTLWYAFQSNFEKHKGVARFTLVIWLYVSITGVLIYLMLYT